MPFKFRLCKKPKFFLFGCPDLYTPGATSEKLIGGTREGILLLSSSSASRIVSVVMAAESLYLESHLLPLIEYEEAVRVHVTCSSRDWRPRD